MTVKMDKFGRILIPKTLRTAKGLKPGDEFEIVESPDQARVVVLKQRPRYHVTVDDSGLLPVFKLVDEQGNPSPPDPSLVDAVQEARRERIEELIERMS